MEAVQKMNKLETYKEKTKVSLIEGKKIPSFAAGDTLRVHVKISEGTTQRVQLFEGLCIARRNSSVGSTFTVMKISHLERVERVFHLYSPRIAEIEVIKRGIVRRAKLYYMRDRRGKAARIVEKNFYLSKDTKKVEIAQKDNNKVDLKSSEKVETTQKSSEKVETTPKDNNKVDLKSSEKVETTPKDNNKVDLKNAEKVETTPKSSEKVDLKNAEKVETAPKSSEKVTDNNEKTDK